MHDPLCRSLIPSSTTLLGLLVASSVVTVTSCDEPRDDGHDDVPWREVIVPLPSGVACSVEVTQPAEGSVLPPNDPVEVEGFATVAEAIAVPETTLAYVVDVSGSTEAEDRPGCGGDANLDGVANTVLDCEVAAFTELHGQATALGTLASVGVAVFGQGAAAADMDPLAPDDPLTEPEADVGPGGGNGVADPVDVVRSADVGSLDLFTPRLVGGDSTNCAAGITQAATILNASAEPNQIVVFLSDGECNAGTVVTDALGSLPMGATVFTFAVGEDSDCDGDPTGRGSLRDIADATGGTCTNVPDPSALPEILPSVIMSELTGLTLRLDGVVVPIGSIMPSLPQEGPASVSYTATLPAPAPGQHEICAESTCVDASGIVHPQECKSFRIDTPPQAECEDVTVSADATCHAAASIDDGSFDPDGDDFSCTQDPPGPYPLGTTEVELTCTDAHGVSSHCTGTVEVIDDTPPAVSSVGHLATLWPPNHSFHGFDVSECVAQLEDNCGELDPTEAVRVERITSDEAELHPGSGNTCDDIVIGGGGTSFELRAERIGNQNGNGRVYEITFIATDDSANHAEATCEVTVPHDQGDAIAVDSGCALCEGNGCGACSPGDPSC